MKVKLIIISIVLLLVMVFACGCIPFMEKIGLINPTDEEQLSPEKKSSDGLVKVLIGFKQIPGLAEQAVVQGAGGKIKYTYHLIPAIAASIPDTAIEALQKNPNITNVELDIMVYALDDELDNSWGVKRIGAGIVHNSGNKGTGVNIAIIDSGIDYTHPDLNTNYVGGHDFVNDDNDPMDDNDHGTHVAGTVAAEDNGIGVVGVAPEASLYALKVLDSKGSGYYSDVIAALQWCVDNGIQITNNSYGSSGDPGETVKDAFDNSASAGVLHVAAAGNSGNSYWVGDNIIYPARYESVIAVAATDQNDKRARWSSTGPDLELSAPGVAINSTLLGGGYGEKSGTSMASPHVAGTAALVIAAEIPNVRAQLQNTADDLGATGWDSKYGYGLVDAAEAAGPPDTVDNPPSVSITNPLDGATVSGLVSIEASATDDLGVVQVDFYVGTTLIETDTTSPYSVSWDSTTVIDGTYTLTATAIDTVSQTASDSISVLVDNVNDPPVADAGPDQTVSDSDGDGVESVTLDGSGSYDPDGTIVSYEWAEEALVLGTTAIITYDFSVGTHAVILTVTDDLGATASDDVILTVNANQPPVADAGPDQTAYVGDTVNFDGSGSSDADGTIVSYDWDFGDGTTGSGVLVEHIYSVVGDYTITLTVTDNGGLTGADTAIVSVSEVPSEIIVFSDSFEVGEWNGLWTEDSQNDWFRSTQRAVYGSYSAEVDGRASDAKLISIPIDLQGRINATITFSWYIERGLDSGEYLAFDVSTDEGTSWVEKARLKGNVDPEDTWHNVSIDLTDISNLQIQFRGKMSVPNEDANLDMVKVVAR